MMNNYARAMVAALLVLAFTACGPVEASTKGKKLIEYGWDVPSTEYLRNHITDMEKIPFDGVVMYVTYKGDQLSWRPFSRARFKPEQYEPAIADLKATKFRTLTDNFIGLITMPGDVEWFDPEWSSVAYNAGCLARVAKQGGCKGIMIDPENYGKYPIWSYGKLPAESQAAHTFDEYYARVRQRGKEFIQAINAEYPDITILTLYGPSLPYVQAAQTPGGDLKKDDYGLLMAFYDGMLDGASRKTDIVDGFEFSYGYHRPVSYDNGRNVILNQAKTMSKNPAEFARHIRCGFGTWADNNSGSLGWHPEDFTKNYYSPEVLRNSLAYALQRSDRYVWVYSERLHWWDMNVPQPYVDALSLAKKGPGEAKPATK